MASSKAAASADPSPFQRNTGSSAPKEVSEAKLEKAERFKDVIETRREEKAAHFQRREEMAKVTSAIDEEFQQISHLIKQRTKADLDREAFLNPLNSEVTQLWEAAKAKRTARTFVLDGGDIQPADDGEGVLSEESRRLLEKLRAEGPAETVTKPSAPNAAASVPKKELDSFDKLMFNMRSQAQPHAKARVEVATQQNEAGEQLESLRKALPEHVVAETGDLSRAEWVERGGDQAFDMHEELDEEEEEEGADGEGAGKPYTARFYSQLEALEKLLSRGESLDDMVIPFWTLTTSSPRTSTEFFRSVLMEIEATNDQTVLARCLYYIMLKIFPSSDFRHPVLSPLRLHLASRLSRGNLETTESTLSGFVCAALLLQTLAGERRYCSEVMIFALNVLLMTVPQEKASAATVRSIVVLPRHAAALWGQGTHSADQPLSYFRSDASPVALVRGAYELLKQYVGLYQSNPSFPVLAQSIREVLQIVVPPPKCHDLHLELVQIIERHSVHPRGPLAMRRFRPRPLRQFEPLLVESDEAKTTRNLKKELTEDKKRIIRHLQAEATVGRRKREREEEEEDKRRTGNLKKLMGELQAQQHIMKTVDVHRAKAKMKKKKSISGDPKAGDKEASTSEK